MANYTETKRCDLCGEQKECVTVTFVPGKEPGTYRQKPYMGVNEVYMDGEVSLNASRQRAARPLQHMNSLRSSEQILSNGGMGYRFNAEGNQVSYRCDVKRVTTINFDRNVIRRELAKLNQRADETSAKLDLCLVTSKVDYEPPFDVNDGFGEAFEKFLETAKAGA